jgi:hypothetical protein
MVRSTDTHRASPRSGRRRTTVALPAMLGVAMLAGAFGCFNPGAGQDPPDRSLYFPVGLAVSNTGNTLFVVNSNFDLRYNAGTLQALDIPEIWRDAKPCIANISERRFDATKGVVVDKAADRTCAAGADVSAKIKTTVRIGAFGADIASTPHYGPDGTPDPPGSPRGRLLIPVRGDATLTLVDYEETIGGDGSVTARKLICSRNPQANSFGSSCAAEWRVGGDANQNSRQLALEGEPFSVAVPGYWPTEPLAPGPTSADPLTFEAPRSVGGIAAIVHQQTGDVSVFVRTAAIQDQTIPQAKLAFTINGLPAGGTYITPLDLLDHPFTPRFLVTTRSQANVFVVSFFGDKGSPDRSGLAISDAIPLPTQSPGYDSRGIVVDPPEDGETRPIRVFLTSRTPASLVIGQIDPDRRLRFKTNEPLPIGPSRIVRTRLDVELPDGTFVKRTRILAASFDGRFVTIYDPDLRRTTDVVRTGKGPYTMVVSPASGTRGTDTFRPALGFVTNFTDSTIQVLDLDPRAGLLDDELDAAGHPELKAPPGTVGPLYGHVIYTVGPVQKPGN